MINVTCADCGQKVEMIARGLCSSCCYRNTRNKSLEQYPTLSSDEQDRRDNEKAKLRARAFYGRWK